MVRTLTIILFSILLYKLSWAQDWKVLDQSEYIAEYAYIVQEDSANADKTRHYSMALYIGEKYSKFEHIGHYYRDSLKQASRQSGNNEASSYDVFSKTSNKPSSGLLNRYRIIKQTDNDSILLTEGTINFTDRIKVEEIIKFDWHLVKSKIQTINGFVCHKATTQFRGRNYTAWYTLEIPISDGPYKFKGLPGLIVKIEDKQKQHMFELVKIERSNSFKKIYTKSENYQVVSMQNYHRYKKAENLKFIELFNNPEKFKTTGNIGEITAKMSRINNFIERF
ncbi:GLPGLI family protein [Carboxylicivirga sp. N1Y90]|uniref:GLPGLI family protein n=1 Tax=Carboxylicivirga fragile TaxID=3417571 RepID=UPI003D3349FD|nr:GLPGLI family protein [Marinilabiliaceae bacterium N1Y90]